MVRVDCVISDIFWTSDGGDGSGGGGAGWWRFSSEKGSNFVKSGAFLIKDALELYSR